MSTKGAGYYRKGFGLKEAIEVELRNAYESDLIKEIRQNDNQLRRQSITIKLAQASGFCWGVDRAVSMAYETRRNFPDKRIWITNEIIHNPVVNRNLAEMDIGFIPLTANGNKDFSCISQGDVVILPAFGACTEEMEQLFALDCIIVDTTCPWVSRVWHRLAKYEQNQFTAIIHGKYNHEETVATSSRSHHYLIVQNLMEAQLVCDFILSEEPDADRFLASFHKACSQGFDPTIHLDKIGIANQTTMLKGETEQIGKLFEHTMLTKFGSQHLDDHFLSPGDTICDATQERQDAMLKLVDEQLDVIVVIGGFNSSNTGHLFEIAEKSGLSSYHIDGPDCILPNNVIRHKQRHGEGCIETTAWLPDGSVTIGITAGASTPDQVVSQVLEKIFSMRDPAAQSNASRT